MNTIKAKSFTGRNMFALALGLAALAGTACGGTGQPPGGTSDVTCGGIAGTTCPEHMFCDFDATCGQGDRLGKCQPIPTTCPQDCTNVCGCDGMQYCNACIAHMAGVDDAPGMSCDGQPPVVQ